MKNFKAIALCAAVMALGSGIARAHDTWVETNTNLIRVGDAIHYDLLLGNHGNTHRDFKVAGKLDPTNATLQIVAPNGQKTDVKSKLRDVGYSPEEGYWTGKYVASQPGLYMVAHSYDSVASYAPVRNIKSAKTFFVAARSLDRVPMQNKGYDRVLGSPLEIVPESNTVTPMGIGTPIRVRVLFKGKPLANTVVSFIPRGANLTEAFDARYERKTNVNGRASYEPKLAETYLVVAHHVADNEKGKGYDSTHYSATMTVFVPQICSCCGE